MMNAVNGYDQYVFFQKSFNTVIGTNISTHQNKAKDYSYIQDTKK